MNKILICGAGKSATALIEYMCTQAATHQWTLLVADSQLATAQAKVAAHPHVQAVQLDVKDEAARRALLQQVEVVISMLPPSLHIIVAGDCVELGVHLLTASYVDDAIRALAPAIEQQQLLFLCEMGLDPGIDHMSALTLLQDIRQKGGVITGFYSHCGGLVAPECDNNPWHYKISWNPRNVVMAGQAGAQFRRDGATQRISYENLFDGHRTVNVPGLGPLAWYPNRDSLPYIGLYDLDTVTDFVRTTLRYPAFCFGWKQIIDYKLTDTTVQYNTHGMSLQEFFRQHFDRFHIDEKSITTQEGGMFRQQLLYLGLQDCVTLINKGECSAADVLQFILEQKLPLAPTDTDMIVMLHQVQYELEGHRYQTDSCLIVKGDDHIHTAMAKTVGLPLGIAACLLMEGKLPLKGLHIPTSPVIYQPVLEELAKHGIAFKETNLKMS